VLTRHIGFRAGDEQNAPAPPGAVNPPQGDSPDMSRMITLAAAAALIFTSLIGADFPTYWP
jgi:hypothetical protein